MKVKQAVFLGSGGSMGVPLPGCDCPVCYSKEFKNKRLRPSFFFQIAGKNVLIDISPDFRQQALEHHIDRVDAVFLSHTHFDHSGGVVDLRMYAYKQGSPIPIYCTAESDQDLRKRFDYLFSLEGVSIIETCFLEKQPSTFSFEGVSIEYYHYYQAGMKVTGFKMGTFAYMTDIFEFDEGVYPFLKGVEHLVLSARNGEKYFVHKKGHLTVDEAVALAKRAGIKHLYLNHL